MRGKRGEGERERERGGKRREGEEVAEGEKV